MINAIYTYSSFLNISSHLIIPSATGADAGLGWDEVNRFISLWNTVYSGANMYLRVCYKMCAVHVAIQDIASHTGSLVQLPCRTVATLSMLGYDTIGYGPVVGGLNGNNLNQSNVFASSGVEFKDVKPAMLEHLKVRFESYKILEQTANRDNYVERLISTMAIS